MIHDLNKKNDGYVITTTTTAATNNYNNTSALTRITTKKDSRASNSKFFDYLTVLFSFFDVYRVLPILDANIYHLAAITLKN